MDVEIDHDIVRALRVWKKCQKEERLAAGPLWKSTVTLANGEELRNDLVFTRPDGSWIPPTKVGQAFHRLRERAELPRIRLHDLRHTHATLLLKAGVNPKFVQERLGHESIAITLDLYGHVLPSMGREVAELVGRMLRGGS